MKHSYKRLKNSARNMMHNGIRTMTCAARRHETNMDEFHPLRFRQLQQFKDVARKSCSQVYQCGNESTEFSIAGNAANAQNKVGLARPRSPADA